MVLAWALSDPVRPSLVAAVLVVALHVGTDGIERADVPGRARYCCRIRPAERRERLQTMKVLPRGAAWRHGITSDRSSHRIKEHCGLARSELEHCAIRPIQSFWVPATIEQRLEEGHVLIAPKTTVEGVGTCTARMSLSSVSLEIRAAWDIIPRRRSRGGRREYLPPG
jgi:hypothetical protein